MSLAHFNTNFGFQEAHYRACGLVSELFYQPEAAQEEELKAFGLHSKDQRLKSLLGGGSLMALGATKVP